MRFLLYDAETKRVPYTGGTKIDGIEYADGWRDFANLGISVVCAFTYPDEKYHVFLERDLHEFQSLVSEYEEIVSFNGVKFDDELCRQGYGINIITTYDILREAYIAAGFDPDNLPRKETPISAMLAGRKPESPAKGFGLDAIAKKNFKYGKSGRGDLAPIWFQQGNVSRVINYCLDDVKLEVNIFFQSQRGYLLHPKKNEFLNMRKI